MLTAQQAHLLQRVVDIDKEKRSIIALYEEEKRRAAEAFEKEKQKLIEASENEKSALMQAIEEKDSEIAVKQAKIDAATPESMDFELNPDVADGIDDEIEPDELERALVDAGLFLNDEFYQEIGLDRV